MVAIADFKETYPWLNLSVSSCTPNLHTTFLFQWTDVYGNHCQQSFVHSVRSVQACKPALVDQMIAIIFPTLHELMSVCSTDDERLAQVP